MKKILISTCIVLSMLIAFFAFNRSYIYVKFFSRTGEWPRDGIKVFVDTLTASSWQQTIDISAAGFQEIPRITVSAERNTSNAFNSPQVSIKTISSTSVVVNITEANNSLVTVLGLSVLGGPAAIPVANPSTVKLHILCLGK